VGIGQKDKRTVFARRVIIRKEGIQVNPYLGLRGEALFQIERGVSEKNSRAEEKTTEMRHEDPPQCWGLVGEVNYRDEEGKGSLGIDFGELERGGNNRKRNYPETALISYKSSMLETVNRGDNQREG